MPDLISPFSAKKRWCCLARLSLLLPVTVASLLLAACSEPPAPPEIPPAEVVVEEVKTHSLSLATELPGRTVAFQSALVRPQVDGILLKRLFTEGADVKADEVLHQVDPAPYQAVLEQAQTELQAARPKAERYRKLVEIDAISHQEADDAMAALRKYEAAVRAARIDLNNTSVKAPISGRIGTSNFTAGALVSA